MINSILSFYSEHFNCNTQLEHTNPISTIGYIMSYTGTGATLQETTSRPGEQGMHLSTTDTRAVDERTAQLTMPV
jgi:hypothetical protein